MTALVLRTRTTLNKHDIKAAVSSVYGLMPEERRTKRIGWLNEEELHSFRVQRADEGADFVNPSVCCFSLQTLPIDRNNPTFPSPAVRQKLNLDLDYNVSAAIRSQNFEIKTLNLDCRFVFNLFILLDLLTIWLLELFPAVKISWFKPLTLI